MRPKQSAEPLIGYAPDGRDVERGGTVTVQMSGQDDRRAET